MARKKQHHEEHVDEAWLLPYSDMLTLLLALFIIMFAMGQTDKAKLAEMSKQFNVIFAGGSSVMEKDGSSVIPMDGAEGTGQSESETEEGKMAQIQKQLEEEIEKQGYSDKVKVDLNNGGLEISMQDVILFNSGNAEVLNDVQPLLLKISNMIYNLDNDIKVVGHTDNVPINNGIFRSNWDLSAIRAINVMNFMVSSGEIHKDKISIQAYGDQKPKFDNSTEEGRAKNRRVEILVARKYPAKTEENNK